MDRREKGQSSSGGMMVKFRHCVDHELTAEKNHEIKAEKKLEISSGGPYFIMGPMKSNIATCCSQNVRVEHHIHHKERKNDLMLNQNCVVDANLSDFW